MQQPDLSERLVKFSIELSEFDIEYQPHKAIKAQALANFIEKRLVVERMIVQEIVGLTMIREAGSTEIEIVPI